MIRPGGDRAPWMRFAAIFMTAIAGLTIIGASAWLPHSGDFASFLDAAEKVASGRTPYGPAPETNLPYLYAPWLAVVLIPLTWPPFPIAAAIWHTLLAAALAVSVWPLLRPRRLEGTLAAFIIGAFGFHGVWIGHLQPLLVAILVIGLRTRYGPLAIGIAASLKILPIIFVIRYAGRGEWRSVLVAIAIATILWAPALLLGLEGYGLPIDQNISLLGHSPLAWAIVAAIAVGVAWVLAPTRYGWLAATVAWLAILPRMNLYDVSGLAVGGTPDSPGMHRQDAGSAVRRVPSGE